MKLKSPPEYIIPKWPIPTKVKALITTRIGGYSEGVYHGFNLASHVEDQLANVTANRDLLQQQLPTQTNIAWLKQTHSNRVVTASINILNADASISRDPTLACAVLTADCLPILLASNDGQQVATIHAGWRGLATGIVQNTLKQFTNCNKVLAYLGPAIGPTKFEVGNDVYLAFTQQAADLSNCFQPIGHHKYLANLYQLAANILQAQQVTQIYGGTYCTHTQSDLFYSYRRDGQTGRMASLIYITA